MAIEDKRGCGYRKVGGIYLVGEYRAVACDRLPLPVGSCPVCGHGIHFTRSLTEINPLKLFGIHENCQDVIQGCWVCEPSDEVAFIMMVGEKFYPTPDDFMNEGIRQGVSKRIPFIPKKLQIGKTILYLAHNKACVVREPVAVQQAMAILEQTAQPTLIDAEKQKHALGIFCAFIPQRIEKLVWESELTDEVKTDLEKRGITPVPVPDGDKDHVS